jgi:pimeloyl-ACP methyl ester carboxylesterase
LAEQNFAVYILDARNHGQSPNDNVHNYDVMADDLAEFIQHKKLEAPIILGHSMGGKTVLQYAQKYDNYEKLIIVDIAPKFYPTHHEHIMAGLNAIPIHEIKSRKEAEAIFEKHVIDAGERQFILKNIYRTDDGFAWRINIPVIDKEIHSIGEEIISERIVSKPVLFIMGSESSYVNEEDMVSIKKNYTNVQFKTIEGANHWVHATKPKEFLEVVFKFINE